MWRILSAVAVLFYTANAFEYREVPREGYELVIREDAITDPSENEFTVKPKFYVDYEAGVFIKDGEPFRCISGSLHYARVPPQYWRDRLKRVYAMGLDAVQTVVPWNFHEPWPGEFDFSGPRDIFRFLRTAQSEGLLVLLRIGPYICAEWDLGGLPSWLLMENPRMRLRTNAEDYILHVKNYWGVLLPKLVPFLYQNGGPVIMVQIENEYGSYPLAEAEHSKFLFDLANLYLGPDTVFYTTDGNSKSYFARGRIPGALTTVDFAPTDDPSKPFQDLKDTGFKGPFVNSELYTGWFQHWGEDFVRFNPEDLSRRLNTYLADDKSYSVSMYMFLGGTTFGFMPGANSANGDYHPDPNSYDYDSPLTENGGCGTKCEAVRKVLLEHSNRINVPDLPRNVSVVSHGLIELSFAGSLLKSKSIVSVGARNADDPITFEELRQDYGFVLYETFVMEDFVNATMATHGLADEAIVMLDGVRIGIMSRTRNLTELKGVKANYGQLLSVLVHSMGRINYGDGMNDVKGVKEIKLGGKVLSDWSMYSIPMNNTENMAFRAVNASTSLPGFFVATFRIPISLDPMTGYFHDTFLKMTSFSRGVAFINGVNLGRYWNGVGPVETLYVPGPFLRERNQLVILELDRADCSVEVPRCYVELLDHPVFIEAVGYREVPMSRNV